MLAPVGADLLGFLRKKYDLRFVEKMKKMTFMMILQPRPFHLMQVLLVAGKEEDWE